MSVVYLAEQVRLKRPAALKLLAPELADDERFRERFLRESELAASLDHPNDHPDLRRRRGRRAALHRDALRRGQRPASAAPQQEGEARARAGASRSPSGRRRARLPPTHTGSSTGTSSPATSCSPPTGPSTSPTSGSPERVDEGASLTASRRARRHDRLRRARADRGRAVDGRADVYSLACVIYECLTGSVPFPRDSPMAKLWAHLRDSPLPAAAD